MNFFQKALSRAVTKAINPDVFAFYFNKAFPNPRKINYAEAYTGWVFACINAIAQDTSRIELIWQQKNKNGDWEDAPEHPALTLLKKPNPVMTGMDLVDSITSWKQIDGNSFLYVAYNLNGNPMELWPLDPTRMIILKDELKIVDGYNYLNEVGSLVPLKYEEVVHLKTFNPSDAYRGVGTVEAARTTIETDVFSTKWNKSLMENSATPESVLQTDKKLSVDVYARLKKAWNNEYRGVENAHKLAILEEGLTLKPTQLTPKEADFLTLRGFNRDEICAMFGVPKIRLGFIEGTNRASADTISYVYVKNTILNEITFIADKLNAFYLPFWRLDSAKYRIWFKNPVPDDETLLIAKKNAGLQYGYYSINEVRAMDGLDPVPGGDQLYIPSLMQPLSDGTEEDSTDNGGAEEVPDEEEDDPQPQPQKKVKAVSQSYKEQQMKIGATKTRAIYEKMEKHVLEKLASTKSVKQSRGKSKRATSLLSRMKDALDDEDGADTPADASVADTALSDFTDVFTPEVLAFAKAFSPDIFQKGGDDTMKGADIEGTFDLKNPRAVKWLDNHALELATQVPETIKGSMGAIISDGIANGQSIQTIRDNIGVFYDDNSQWMAERVARTETITAYEQGSLEGAKQGNLTQKSWIKQGDTEPDICNDNEDEGWIAIDDDFVSGDDAPAAHPNCECGLIYQ